MKIFLILEHILLSIKYYKLKTFFSIVGIALGIASLSIIVASVEGAFRKAYDVVESFGPDSILIFGGSQEKKGIRNREKTLIIDDLESIKGNFPYIKVIMPIVIQRNKVRRGDSIVNTTIYGVGKNYEEAWNWYLKEGKFFTDEDIKNKRYVCVIGVYIKNELFKNSEEPLGKNILINKTPCKVIGILEPKGTTITGRNLDNRVLLPYTTVMYKINHDPKYISAIRIRFYKGVDISEAVSQIKEFLLSTKGYSKSNNFFILTPTEILRFLMALTGSLIIFLGISSVISLTVGGFVLANLFLLSVQERKREIGIRRSLGAKGRDILFQFILEAVILTIIGGILGFILGIVGSFFLKKIADFPIYFSFLGFITALTVSVLVGVLAVLKPSIEASKLNPIEAIRE